MYWKFELLVKALFFSVFFLDSLVLAGTEDALNELHLSTYQFMSKELLYDGLLF